MPPERKGKLQMTSAQVVKIKKIANRCFRSLQHEILITLVKLLHDVLVIFFGICNLTVPILK